MTPAAIVDTKLFVPRPRAGLVPRPRLDELLDARTRLTLISAPAGFGKSTLLMSWLANQSSTPVAWVSFDEGDNRPEAFWTYVLTALERAAPGTGAGGLTLLESSQQVDAAIAVVLNELSVLPSDLVLVLDDYHLAESAELQAGVALLIDRLPPQVRLVISTRQDPTLPLARLRSQGELTELRAADLRFTTAETTSYLAQAAGLELAETDVSALEARTEGWVASLQLAALSLRGRDDPSRFIEGFAGDDRYVVDYLVEEVLDRQPPDVREFLLGTALLERLTGPLCDAVTGTTDGAKTLELLERRNLFVVPLDDQRRWYRYHHLFADVLRAHLLAEQPDRVPGLHARASSWYHGAGEPVLAVKHALAAGDFDRAADLMELANPALARDRQEAVINAWCDQLPVEVTLNRPVLAMQFVGGRMSSNAFTGVEDSLRIIESQLTRVHDELVFHDLDELTRLPAQIEMYRAALALNSGDPSGTIAHANQAASLATPEDDLTRGAASALSGLASWTTGDLDAAHAGYTAAIERLTKADRLPDVLGCSITLADLELTLGRLDDAERTFTRALSLPGADQMRGAADMWTGLARIAWHRGDPAKAAELLRKAGELGDEAGLAQNPYRWRRGMALLRNAQGDTDAAVRLLDEAIQVYVGDYSPDVQPVAATRTRVLAAIGRADDALKWSREQGLSADDELSYFREYDHVTLAGVLLASGAAQPALDLLDRLLAAAEEGGRTGTVIEILVLQALARRDPVHLERALGIAEKDGWIQVFAGEGAPMRELLGRIADSPFRQRILAAMQAGVPPEAPRGTPQSAPDQSPLVDPLSERELEVLRLLASELGGPDIARHLVVSLNTVRTHTKHIYTKLDVNSRRSAVAKAHGLGLLTR